MIREGYSIKAEVITTEGEYTVCHFHVDDIFSDELFLLVLCYVSKYGSDLRNDIDLPWILTYISMQNDLIHFLNKDIEAIESAKKAIPVILSKISKNLLLTPDLLQMFLETFQEEDINVQLQLLTATVRPISQVKD